MPVNVYMYIHACEYSHAHLCTIVCKSQCEYVYEYVQIQRFMHIYAHIDIHRQADTSKFL